MKIKLLSLAFLLICSASVFAETAPKSELYHADVTVTPTEGGKKLETAFNFLSNDNPPIAPVSIPGFGLCIYNMYLREDGVFVVSIEALTPIYNGAKELTAKEIFHTVLPVVLDTDISLLKTSDYTLSVKLTQPAKKKD